MAYTPPPRPVAMGVRCDCRFSRHAPDFSRAGAVWTQQVLPECELHWPLLPVFVKVRVLLNEGYRF